MEDEIHENLTLELDFLNEAENMKRATRNFGQSTHETLHQPGNQLDNQSINPLVKIPIVFDQFTSKRVLTMEFINGVKISSVDQLIARDSHLDDSSVKKSVNRVLKQTINALSEQIFLHGFVNCDPHSGK